ncbi:tyrosine phosphatase-like protein [Dinothrombium tinctorium]|uniref:protein-tyrosine-phosphatase n=1 Tax=Dinothrombium tinctorium TaxID=1965070 RepID=A0A3S3SHG9_9ACAR|nr:tyrosine phosphatase-like protein [Dinothrombium tinctorium]
MAKLSLKAVLKNFLNHYQTLESRRKSNSEDDLYLKEFLAMKELTESLKNDVHYSCSHGLKEVNRRKNRYKDILPCKNNSTETSPVNSKLSIQQTESFFFTFVAFVVRIVKWRQVCPDFLVRTLKITCDNKSRRVCQFHYTTWPDHGVPSTVQPILELVRLMRDCESRETRPILVHCSAGCGRTGTICSIDYVWALLRTGRLTEGIVSFSSE